MTEKYPAITQSEHNAQSNYLEVLLMRSNSAHKFYTI